MKKLIKKSLDELAKTMDVISEEEQSCYWGMDRYENDCFWWCVAYLSSSGAPVSEAIVAGLAEEYFAGVGHYAYYNLSVTNDAQMTNIAMTAYINENPHLKNKIVGFPNCVLAPYIDFVGTGYHVLIFKGPDPSDSSKVRLYNPQTGTNISMPFEVYNREITFEGNGYN